MASPNMNAIAHAAGVGKATVSLALRNDPRLRPETRERIQKIAAEMGYHTNAVVSHLMAQLRASRDPKFQATVALINASGSRDGLMVNPTFRSWVKGCGRRCVELGYAMDEFWLHEPDISPARLRHILKSRNIRGVIVAAVLSHRELPAEFDSLWSEMACVVVGIRPVWPPLHFACNDQFSTAFQVAEELRQRGYKKPGLVIDHIIEENIDYRFSAGFYAGQGAAERKQWIPTFDFKTDAKKAFKAWLDKYKPDAIVCAHKEVRAWLDEFKLRAPKDIGLAHLDFNADELDGWCGMNQNNDLVGAAAVDLIVGELHRNEAGIPPFPKCVMIESLWAEGKTLRKR
jgi:DNA-binding LacI/PurR family transcriptional regulator